MIEKKNRIVFGPVPSRRFGQSLGVNNIPPKICSYSCIYCQIGITQNMQIERKEFYKPQKIFEDVINKINKAEQKNEAIDYITFVPDGEPTLDINLKKEIEKLKSLKIRIAIITNGSLLWRKDVKEDLSIADCVSIKIDSVNEKSWNNINRPHQLLKISKLLSGLYEFSQVYSGDIITETMLIKNLNDNILELEKLADFIEKLNPKKSYISIPTRPPAEKWVKQADELDINTAYQILKGRGVDAELLTSYEGNAFAFTGNFEEELLSIISVHPMREEGVKNFLLKANLDWNIIDKLIDDDELIELKYRGKKIYMRKIQ